MLFSPFIYVRIISIIIIVVQRSYISVLYLRYNIELLVSLSFRTHRWALIDVWECMMLSLPHFGIVVATESTRCATSAYRVLCDERCTLSIFFCIYRNFGALAMYLWQILLFSSIRWISTVDTSLLRWFRLWLTQNWWKFEVKETAGRILRHTSKTIMKSTDFRYVFYTYVYCLRRYTYRLYPSLLSASCIASVFVVQLWANTHVFMCVCVSEHCWCFNSRCSPFAQPTSNTLTPHRLSYHML